MALTPLSKALAGSLGTFALLVYFDVFSRVWLVSSVTLLLMLVVSFYFAFKNDRDMDPLAAFILSDRGFKVPNGKKIPPTMQNGVLFVEGDLPSLDETCEFFEKNIWRFDRMRRCVRNSDSSKSRPSVWNVDVYEAKLGIDVQMKGQLITEVTVDNDDELYQELDRLCNEYIPKSEPQWRIHLIRNPNGFASIWLLRASHSIADGLRLVGMACSFMTDASGQRTKTPTLGKAKGSAASSSSSSKKNQSSVQKMKKKNKSMMDWIQQLLRDLKMVDSMSNGRFDTVSPFKPDCEVYFPEKQQILRNYLWAMPLSFVKTIKNHYNCSVNDVLSACVAGAIERYNRAMIEQGLWSKKKKNEDEEKEEELTRAMVAFGFPSKRPYREQADWLRNDTSFVSFRFPKGSDDFGTRIEDVKKVSSEMKSSLQPLLVKYPTELLIRFGFSLFDDFLEQAATEGWRRHSLIFSNVPTWKDQQYLFNGAKIIALEASYLNITNQIILASYNGFINGTYTCDSVNRMKNGHWIPHLIVLEAYQEYLHVCRVNGTNVEMEDKTKDALEKTQQLLQKEQVPCSIQE